VENECAQLREENHSASEELLYRDQEIKDLIDQCKSAKKLRKAAEAKIDGVIKMHQDECDKL